MSLSYPEILKRFRRRHNETEALKKIENQLAGEVEIFMSCQTCLSIGTGYGELDIDFIERCLPNLKKLIVVERDRDCVEELKVNLEKSFGTKLQFEIHQKSIEAYMAKRRDAENNSTANQIDIVIAFHVLYFMTTGDRLELLNLCFDSWLRRDGGLFFYVIATESNDMLQIQKQLRQLVRPFHNSDDIKKDVEAAGLKLWREILFEVDFDLSLHDEDISGMILAARSDAPITREVVEEAIKKIVPSGQGVYEAAVGLVVRRDV